VRHMLRDVHRRAEFERAGVLERFAGEHDTRPQVMDEALCFEEKRRTRGVGQLARVAMIKTVRHRNTEGRSGAPVEF
jgi:hypothetical protein